MNAYSRPRAVTLPTLSANWVRIWMEQTQDIVFLLDALHRIAGVFQNEHFDETDTYHWIGQELNSVVSADSRPKLQPLLDNDASLEGGDARWRHLNLVGLNGQVLPVLAKCMSWPGDGFTKAVFCRDLRPLQEANDRFVIAQQELEQRNQSLQTRLQQKEDELFALAALHPHQLVRTIKETSYTKVIEDTVHHLERQCLEALLRDAGGDNVKAAEMAGLDLTEWLKKLASLS